MNADVDSRPNKRARTSLACQSCRAKKLSCEGGRPCTRCRRNHLDCLDGERSERTPLTRKRMTELEEELDDFNEVWNELFPSQPFDTVREQLSSVGLHSTVQRLRATSGDGNRCIGSNSLHDNGGGVPAGYPATMPSSPHDLSLRLDLPELPAAGVASSEWHENDTYPDKNPNTSPDQLSNLATTPANDFGTGVSGAIGYIGLSSGSTLLRAISKFTPQDEAPAESVSGGGLLPSAFPSMSPATSLRAASKDQNAQAPVLPPAKEARRLLDSFFQYFHALTPVVHEPTVRAQVTGAIPMPTGTGSHVLFNMIFATGAFDAAIDESTDNDGFQYYELARAALQRDVFDGGSIVLVQGLAVMAIYLQRNGRPNTGYICLGFAIRMAMALGIHVSPAEPISDGSSVLDGEMRCRLWWCLVTLETGQSMTYGRPHSINLGSLVTSRLPLNIHDADLTVSTMERPSNDDGVTVYTALIVQAVLSQTVLQLYDRISRSKPAPTAQQIKWCGDQFKTKLETLPSYTNAEAQGSCVLACAVQRWRSREYRSLLYRPVLLSAAWNHSRTSALRPVVQSIIDTCRELATQNLQEIATYVRTNPDPRRGSEWCTLYFAMQASLPILLSLVWEPQHVDALFWRSLLDDLCVWLGQLSSMRKLGSTYAGIVMRTLSAIPTEARMPGADTDLSNPEEIPPLFTDAEIIDYERFFSEIWNIQDGQMMGFESFI